MHITITARVSDSPYDYNGTSREATVITEATWPESLPWAKICANLVEGAIEEHYGKKRKAKAEEEAQHEE